jgi:hypothetical protein
MSYLVAAPEFLVSAAADLVPVGSSERGECGSGCPYNGGAGVPVAPAEGQPPEVGAALVGTAVTPGASATVVTAPKAGMPRRW